MSALVPSWVPPRALAGLGAVVVIALSLPSLLDLDNYTLNLLTLTLSTMAAAMAWNWLGGYLGQVSFGHAALFGLGGFVAARLQMTLGLPLVVAWAGGGLVAGLYALAWGHPTLRLRGPYFSIATIGVGEATRLVLTYWGGLTGGSSGLSLPVRAGLKHDLYYYGVGLAALTVCASFALRRSSFGLQLLAIKSDVDAANDVGVSSVRLQDAVLFLSGATLGVCGGFYADFFSFIEPSDMFGFERSISFVLMGVIGGVGTIFGPALGAAVFVLVRQFLIASYPQLYLGLYGTLLVMVILFEPLGLVGLGQRAYARLVPPRGARVIALRCERLTKRYGGLQAVGEVDLSVDEGQILGVIGPNGAGKTTLFSMLAGSVPPTSGRVFLGERDITSLPAFQVARAGVVRTHQVVRPFHSLTVVENCTVAATHDPRHGSRGALARAEEALRFVGLADRAHQLPAGLTLAGRKKLELARALALGPRVLLLDEVIAGVNPAEARDMAALIRRIRDERGVSIVMIEHVMAAVMSLSDQVVVLDAGRRIAAGQPEVVVRDPAVIAAYLGRAHAPPLPAGSVAEETA